MPLRALFSITTPKISKDFVPIHTVSSLYIFHCFFSKKHKHPFEVKLKSRSKPTVYYY